MAPGLPAAVPTLTVPVRGLRARTDETRVGYLPINLFCATCHVLLTLK